MIWWAILGVYAIGYVAMWRTVVWHLINEVTGNFDPDGTDVTLGVVCGSFFALFWPAVAAALCVRAVYRAREEDAVAFLVPRRDRRRIALEERERRIRDLERQLGLGYERIERNTA